LTTPQSLKTLNPKFEIRNKSEYQMTKTKSKVDGLVKGPDLSP